MDLLEATEAFAAMDAYGHPQTIPKSAILHAVGDSTGFLARTSARELASFIYLGSLLYAWKDRLEACTHPMMLRTGQQGKAPIRASRKMKA